MQKIMLGLALMGILGVFSGCAASTINIISDQALERMEPESRAKYRGALDKADLAIDGARILLDKTQETIGQARSAFDDKYNADGTFKTPPVPAPVPDPVE